MSKGKDVVGNERASDKDGIAPKLRVILSNLAQRLKEVYSLEKAPTSVNDFAALWRENLSGNQRAREFIGEVRAGKRAIEETFSDRGYSVLKSGASQDVMCGLDTLATAYLRKNGPISARCPHCPKQMEIVVTRGRIVKNSPERIVFWLGTGPIGAPGNPRCDHLHLFPSSRHLAEWLRSKPGELGIKLSLREAFKLGSIFDV